jgi:arabinogalactan oligomer / maltooligosaccharide transport system permease protein
MAQQVVEGPVQTASGAEASVPAVAQLPVRRRRPDLAAALSIVPGLGQLYNFQPKKALFFFLSTLLTLGPSVLLIMGGERWGHSLLVDKAFGAFMLVAFGSIIAFLVLFLLGLTFWTSAIVDARRSARELSEGRPGTQRWWLFKL